MFTQLMRCLLIGGAALFCTSCIFTPQGTDEERHKAAAVGGVNHYDDPFIKRHLPDLPSPATWRDVLQRAFYANGELEARYFDWRAALHQIDIAAGYPNQNIDIGFDSLFGAGRMKTFDRLTVSATFDETLTFPSKVAKKGQLALADAKVAGARFEATKFDLQRRVLTQYLDLALEDEQTRIATENVSVLQLLTDSARNRVAAGGAQQDLLKAQIAFRLAENDLKNLLAARRATAANLNALMDRAADAPLLLPDILPPRPLPADDAQLIAVATDLNPELRALAAQVQGRQNALELARMAYIPDFSPTASLTGTASQVIGLSVMLPTTLPQIRAAINEARDNLSGARATLRQTQQDRAASFVANLVALRNAEREVGLLENDIAPLTKQALAAARQNYATGNSGFIELIDAQRTLLDVRTTVAEARIEREKRLADLEALAGVDIETLDTEKPKKPDQ